MSKITKAENAWIRELQRVLDSCPSSRLGFYTVGDPWIAVYDRDKQSEIYEIFDVGKSDYCTAVDRACANLGKIVFPSSVYSTAG